MKTRPAPALNRGAMLLASLLSGVAGAPAQTVIAPSSTPSAAALAAAHAAPASGGGLAGITSAYSPGMPLFKRSAISVRPELQYRWLTVNELQVSPGQRVNTTVQEVSPGVLLELGQRWSLVYTASWISYSHDALDTTVNHSAALSGSVTRGNWSFTAGQTWVKATSVLFETGQQTEGESYSTSFESRYALSERTTAEINLAHDIRHVTELTSSDETSITGWLRQKWTSRISTALGLSAGYADVRPGSDMTYYRPQGQITWRLTDKIHLNAEGGVESRAFRSGERGDLSTPLYGGSVEYHPFKTMKLVFGADRYVATSYFANAITRNQSVHGSLEQRLFQKLYFTGRLATYDTNHIPTQRGVSIERDDRRRILNLSLSAPFLRRGSAAVFYQEGRNLSSVGDYTFDSRQYGFELAYRF